MTDDVEATAGISGASQPHTSTRALHPQFEDIDQQRDADSMGIWVFLATEVMFFGGLFAAYAVYRSTYYLGFQAGSHLLERTFGAVMTFILIGSSFTMAMGVHAVRTGARKLLVAMLLLTILLGAIFLAIKFTEYHSKWQEHLVPGLNFHPSEVQLKGASGNAVDLFMCFYFFMTGLHALHMIIGIGVLLVMTVRAWKGTVSEKNYQQIEVSGLYWHFVDIIWIYLFPLLYLIGGPS